MFTPSWPTRRGMKRMLTDRGRILAALCLMAFIYLFAPREDLYNGLRRTRSVLEFIPGLSSGENRVRQLRALMVKGSGGDYNLHVPNMADWSRGQSKVVDELLFMKENGFFLEIGAGDGEKDSVSLFFEKFRNWDGVLVEANPEKFKNMVAKNRKATLWNVAVKLDKDAASNPQAPLIEPELLFKLINHTEYDLLSINLHGYEVKFLRSLNLDLIHIKVITVEMEESATQAEYTEITDYLSAHGYKVAHHIINGFLGKKDVVYARKELVS